MARAKHVGVVKPVTIIMSISDQPRAMENHLRALDRLVDGDGIVHVRPDDFDRQFAEKRSVRAFPDGGPAANAVVPSSATSPKASAGNTGGNEESGLYFELRHLGKAFDPASWINF